ncbi:TIGR02677 family protein [Aceticella autotrophica]|uniref:TIGR02677 family protein n=1 Tax=Aceticella autotrophica TaxID=2755338 RepID=A0A975AWQ1_9THEO|nr:TIGR02677 family protein [Aceticella autotrophica]QSZ27786.1 TIGR02677 family protein [Aceticella autotrophica]
MGNKLDLNVIKPIDEVKYLSAENASRYRLIMRYFYEQYQKLKYWMYKEDIYEYVRQFDIFNDYTLEKCEQDLKALTEWKNLIATQDTSKASTIDEFKNKKFRYQLSPYSIEIERMTIRLEGIIGYGGSLQPSLFERIYRSIINITDIAKKDDLQDISRWWEDLNVDFENIYHNATDYIASLQSSNADELMKSEQFIIYKDKLIDYLRDFIKDLQRFSIAIQGFLQKVNQDDVNLVIDKLCRYEMSIPRIDRILSEKEIKEDLLDKWNNISFWFTGYNFEDSEASRLLNISNEIIRKITMYAARIAENRMKSVSRKNDYLILSKMFANANTLKEANLLSAAVFGSFYTRHITGDFERKTESITQSIWEEQPFKIIIKPKTRNYSSTTKTSAILDKSSDKTEILKEYLNDKRYENEIISKCIIGNRICIKDLPIVKPFVRAALLKWIGKAMGRNGKTGKTEDGRTYRVHIPKDGERAILRCTDGNLDMPAIVIEFVD